METEKHASHRATGSSNILYMSDKKFNYLSPDHSNISSIKSIDNYKLLCTNESCPYQIEYEASQRNKTYEVDVNKICSNQLCPYAIPYQECSDEPVKRVCTNKYCPFMKKYGKCGADLIQRVEKKKKCTNVACRLKMLCQQCNVRKRKIKIQKLCYNEFCPYKMYYDECVNLEGKRITGATDQGLCKSDLCPYKEVYHQCDVFKSKSRTDGDESPYRQSVISEAEKDSNEIVAQCIDLTYSIDRALDPSTKVCPIEEKNVKYETCGRLSDVTFAVKHILDEVITTTDTFGEYRSEWNASAEPCNKATCEIMRNERQELILPFKEVISFAEEYIDDIICDAEVTVKKKLVTENFRVSWKKVPLLHSLIKSVPLYLTKTGVCWPSIRQFTVSVGIEKISEFMNSMEMTEEWLFGIYYLRNSQDKVSILYHYEVLCALPTNIFPIPQATATVYFTIEVSRVIPEGCPVEVTYQLEMNRCINNAESVPIDERWLLHILKTKIAFYSSIKY